MRKLVVPTIILITLVALAGACGPAATPVSTTAPPTATPVPEPSPTPTVFPVEVLRDVAYVADDVPEHKLDIYRPQGQAGPFPALFVIHGGGDSKSRMASVGYYFARRGYAVVAINHRQMPQYKYPTPVLVLVPGADHGAISATRSCSRL